MLVRVWEFVCVPCLCCNTLCDNTPVVTVPTPVVALPTPVAPLQAQVPTQDGRIGSFAEEPLSLPSEGPSSLAEDTLPLPQGAASHVAEQQQ